MKNFLLQISYDFKRVQNIGLSYIINKVLSKFLLLFTSIILIPFAIILHIMGYRIASPFTNRIGHLSIEPDCIIKDIFLGSLNVRPKKILLLSPQKVCANYHLDKYWGDIFTLVRSPVLIWLLKGLSFFKIASINTKNYVRNIGGNQSCFQIYSRWGDKPPILKLSAEDEEYWLTICRELGMPTNAWYVCIHARTGSYSEIDESIQSYRNCNIENYNLAIKEILSRGGWVIRIGDKTMPAIKPKERVIDYAHSNLKSERIDVILCAKAKFILGCSSGLACLATVFGTPCAITNLVPVSNLWFTKKDLSIPKSILSDGGKKRWTIVEILNSEASNYQYKKLYDDASLTLIENTEEEILDLTLDMFDKIDNIEDDKNLIQLKTNISNILKPHHYSYGSQATISLRYLANSTNRNSPLVKNLNFIKNN